MSLITRELQKKRDLFEVVQELQQQQREELRRERPGPFMGWPWGGRHEDGSRFDVWQRTPEALAQHEKRRHEADRDP